VPGWRGVKRATDTGLGSDSDRLARWRRGPSVPIQEEKNITPLPPCKLPLSLNFPVWAGPAADLRAGTPHTLSDHARIQTRAQHASMFALHACVCVLHACACALSTSACVLAAHLRVHAERLSVRATRLLVYGQHACRIICSRLCVCARGVSPSRPAQCGERWGLWWGWHSLRAMEGGRVCAYAHIRGWGGAR
jgi:hypothetical protein